MAIGLLLTTITTFFDILLVLRINTLFYIPDSVFILFTNLFEDFLNSRYSSIANGVINAKVTPHAIEATIFAIFTGTSNLGFGVIGNIFGTYLADLLQINETNLGNLYYGLMFKFGLSLIPFSFLFLLPNKNEIESDEGLHRLNKIEPQSEILMTPYEKEV